MTWREVLLLIWGLLALGLCFLLHFFHAHDNRRGEWFVVVALLFVTAAVLYCLPPS